MSIYLFFTLMVFCLLATYLCSITYVKYLRDNTKKKIRDIDLILVSILFGGPVVFVMWCAFPEIRDEDMVHHHRVLISSIIISLIQITIIVLLFVFGVIELAPQNNETTEALLRVF